VERQAAFELGGLSFDNWYRMQQQNEKTISVIIGNPPYNANQQNENDNNRNRDYPVIDQRIKETYVAESTAQKTKQYDMYKRFIRWASDRLDDDGIIAFITNRSYLITRQDDGFRKVVAQEFSDIYILDLRSDVRRNPKISGTTHNVFGIQTGVAIGFLVREKAKLGRCGIHYAKREDEELAIDKLAYLGNALLDSIEFEDITPDKRGDWFNQSNPDFEHLMPLANRQTKLAKITDDEQALFRTYSMGVVTNRDDWVYDFDATNLGRKVRTFIDSYEDIRAKYGGKAVNDSELGTSIKWTRDLKRQLRSDSPNIFDRHSIRLTLYRPFADKLLYYHQSLNEMQYQLPQVFPTGEVGENRTICFLAPAARRPFAALATDKVPSLALFIDGTQSLPLYRYTEDGERVSNITDWGLKRINDHYRKEFGRHFEEVVGAESITAEDIFAYTYAVLHDPVYRYDYKNDLLREFPRLPLYHDFDVWRDMGRELLDLHIGFEDAEPYPLKRVDKSPPSQPSPIKGEGAIERVDKSPPSQPSSVKGEGAIVPRVMLRANKQDKERGEIQIDSETKLVGVPESAWRYMLGNRSALEWVLDQYKEKKPRDPTIREKFNTYRFADYKELVIELLRRVCTVSVKTMDVVDRMAYWDEHGHLVVFGDRDKHEWSMMALQSMFSRSEDEERLAALAALPDIREREE
jgi:predicted helicase